MNSWEKIGDHLDTKGFDKDDFQTLMKFIDAIDHPIELPRVLENLLQIIPALASLSKLYSGFDLGIHLREWQAICLELKSAHAIQKMLIVPKKRGKMPLRGYYDKNPVYVAIWQRPGSPSDQRTYFQLLAHALIAVAILRERTDRQKNHGVLEQELDHFNINSALLAVRNLSVPENLFILEALPDLTVGPETLLGIFEKSCDDLAPLKVLLKYLLHIRRPPHRQEHGSLQPREQLIKPNPRNHLPARMSEIHSNHDPEQEEAANTFDLLQLPAVEEKKARDIESLGCSPTEISSGVEIISPRMKEADYKQVKSPGQKVGNKRRIKTQLAMLNQRLTSRWEVLSLYEVSVCLTAIADLIVQKEKSKYLPDNTSSRELSALLSTLFWFGQRPEKVIKLKIYTYAPSTDDTDPGFVTITEQDCYWWTKPAVPERKKLPDEVQQSQAYITVSNFALFSGIGIEPITSAYNVNSHRRRSTKLFPKDLTVYKKMLSDFFSYVNSHHATRLTANRVSDYLFDVISRQEGADLATAMFIIGREHFLGRNPSYYTSIPVTHLQALYKKVCGEVRQRHFSERPRDNQRPIDNDLPEHGEKKDQASHVGSPFRPTQQTVSNLVSELQTSLDKAEKSGLSALKLMRLHNNMSRYTAFLIAYSTGFRAIRDPFLSSAEIDWDSGFAVLSDKDNEDSYNSRLIWLPPVCLQQLRLFRQHQQNALYRFNVLIPGLFSMLDRPRRDAPGRYMFFAKEDEESKEYLAVTIGPTLLGRRLRSVYALPFNSSRHYLRSNLLERQCPVEVVNAFMGHFERGEEPWGIYSGLSPLVYRDILKDKLVPLLKEDGWEALSGLKVQL